MENLIDRQQILEATVQSLQEQEELSEVSGSPRELPDRPVVKTTDSVASAPPGVMKLGGQDVVQKTMTTQLPPDLYTRDDESVPTFTFSQRRPSGPGGPSGLGGGSPGGGGTPPGGSPRHSQGQPMRPPGITGALGVGQLKLEPPPQYKGGRFPGVRRFLTDVEHWMRLMRYP